LNMSGSIFGPVGIRLVTPRMRLLPSGSLCHNCKDATFYTVVNQLVTKICRHP